MTTSLGDRVRSLRLPPPEKSRGLSQWIPWVLCGLLAVVCAVFGFFAFGKYQAGGSRTANDIGALPSERPEDGASPGATSPTAATGKIALESKGYIIPAHRILVSPKVSGLMLKLNIEEGQIVEQGFVLGEIEDVEYRREWERADAARRAADYRNQEAKEGSRQQEKTQIDKELEEALKQFDQYDADLRRAEELRKSNTIPQQEYDATKARYETQQRRIDRLEAAKSLIYEGPRYERKEIAKAELDEAVADEKRAKWRLDNCLIKAPIAGTILKKNTEEGNIVNAIAFNGSFSVCEMADLSDLEVDMNIQERDISKVFVGQKCDVRAEAYPNRVYKGFVSRLMPIADRAKGAIPVRVKVSVPFEEQGQYLKPDMGAIVAFRNEGERNGEKEKPAK